MTAAPVDDQLFRSLLRRQATTVVVVTAPGHPATGGQPAGLTATSFTSVSLEPQLVSFCLSRHASCFPTMARADYLGLHLLAEHQREVARTFASSRVDRFAHPTRWRPGPYQVPLLDEALVWLVCRVVQRVPAGDHEIVLAEPVLGRHADDGLPLLYHMGRYTAPQRAA
jgi:flavin reductase (DIM6/NTAB) family NADH-FMN oxidoreductase RutF